MDNKSNKENNAVKKVDTDIPKIPTLSFGFKRPSMFSGNKGFVPKGNPRVKFNQSTFHTQHKGGTSGGK